MKRSLEACYRQLPHKANVLDIGCLEVYQRTLGKKPVRFSGECIRAGLIALKPKHLSGKPTFNYYIPNR